MNNFINPHITKQIIIGTKSQSRRKLFHSLNISFKFRSANIDERKVKNINTNPGGLDPYDFALRASEQTWREFAKPVPKPMFHGIYAASFREDLKIEGNHLVLMQNLRNFTVQFELLRQSGVPV